MSAGDSPVKAAAPHPPYLTMIKDAIVEIGNKKGSSRPAITKHLLAKYPDLDGERSRTYLRTAFRTGLASEALVLARKEGKGAGSYKIAKAEAEKKPKEKVVKKVEVPKKTAKKVVEGKTASKKVTPKKGSTSSGKGAEGAKVKKVVKKTADKASKSPAAKMSGKGPASKAAKSPAAKKTGKSPAAKKAAAKKAIAKSPVAKKTAKLTTLVTRSRSRERRRGGGVRQEEKQRGASPSPPSRGLRQVAVALDYQEPGLAASGANLELPSLPSNLKSSPRSRSRGGNSDLPSVRRSPRRIPSPGAKK